MNGFELAETVFGRFGTRDVFRIAEEAKVEIVYERWVPVTAGEFEAKTRMIRVNLDSGVPAEEVVAHELGHFFLREAGSGRRHGEEHLCDEFAEAMTGRK